MIHFVIQAASAVPSIVENSDDEVISVAVTIGEVDSAASGDVAFEARNLQRLPRTLKKKSGKVDFNGDDIIQRVRRSLKKKNVLKEPSVV